MVKKLLLFIPILLLLLLPTNTYAQTYNLTFNSFLDTAENLSSNIQCNNNQCIVYNVPFYNYRMDFEWGTTSSPTCSSTAVVSGILYLDNTSFGINNNDFNWSRVYLVPSGSGQTYNCSFSVSENGTSYVCTAPNLSSNFKIGYTLDNNFGGQTSFTSVVVRNVDINCDTSTGQIIENNNQNTQNIINNQNQNTQDIINNQDSNTQDIIYNQNSNNQQQIESQKVCNTFDKNSISTDNSFLTSNGSIYSQNAEAWGITDYINIYDSEVTVLTNYSSSYAHICYYDVNKELISCSPVNSLPDNSILNLPTNYYYFRLSIAKSYNRPSIRVCKNGNQALSDNINGLNDTLNSEATPNTNQDIQDMEDMTASDTPISDLITMPLTLIHAYINGINSSCSPVNLGNLYGTNLTIPCLNLEQKFGSNLWSIIDVLFSIFMCYNIGMLFITAFSGITSLRDDFDSLYVPKHSDTGYQPKHGGGS